MWDTDWAVWMLMGGAAAAFVALQFLSAPYGRHAREGWGPTVGQRWGWFWMEIPTLAVFLPVFAMGEAAHRTVPRVLVGLWLVHYVHRTLVYPLRIRASGKRTPWVVVGMAFVFQVLNSGLNADWIAGAGHYPKAWLWDPRFVAGVALFGLGQGLNHHSDRILRNLRAPGETGYRIPYGGGFRWVSCPNYLGEILIWAGWALATWSVPGLLFLLFTCANLIPRARQNHAWYRERFADYPDRKALFPGLW